MKGGFLFLGMRRPGHCFCRPLNWLRFCRGAITSVLLLNADDVLRETRRPDPVNAGVGNRSILSEWYFE